ncbi:axonemal dynein light chain domain-containing protein 1 isoform X2 [Melanotaenia boesemani]|uniref:axonemal dynein light chain domain-containing protein 1 isoform X2 n=1 Tax=Melanotaenia boesemani TaxID=1250792 RepID=UPI001C056B52|nr:axonemal dynein light chain domain-containing protein 1 isoform X2 [Melanotaenia boesemani]
MLAPTRSSSAPGLSKSKRASDTTEVELNIQVPAEPKKKQPLPGKHGAIPHELLVSLPSIVCNKSTQGFTAHYRHCQSTGIRRPDAVWHHSFGRKKYKYFLEQPTSVTGAGSDISFLCDAVVKQKRKPSLPPVSDKTDDQQNMSVLENVIPEEYYIVKNKGLRSLELYEDAFTVQLKDEDQKFRILPSLRPSGRLEAVQLMNMMDDMLEKAGVNQQIEELTELSQMEGLLELVKAEQNIYSLVFHELIRQVSVNCAERGQLLAKLRQHYQSLLDRIPRRLKALHTEVVAQRALDRRLVEEIHRIKTSIEQLSVELSKTRDHDTFVSQQAESAHQQLAEALRQKRGSSDVVQGYHELYELHRARLEAQLHQMTEDRDCWRQFTFTLALKVINIKKLQVVSQLHVSEQGWFKTAEQCFSYLFSKDTEDLNTIKECTDSLKQQLVAFVSELKTTEDAQCAQISATKQGITKWLSFFSTQNESPQPNYDKRSVEEIHADLKQWSDMLALQCEHYQGKKQLLCQQKLTKLSSVQEKWLNINLRLFERHPSPDAKAPEVQHALRELDRVLSDLLVLLDMQASGEEGIHTKIMTLVCLMKPWVSKTASAITSHNVMPAFDQQDLKEELCTWQIIADEVIQRFSITLTENKMDRDKPDIYTETEKLLDDVQEFTTNLSDFIQGENQKLREEVSSVHLAQRRWMLDFLVVTLPDYSEEQNQRHKHHYIANISPHTLNEDARLLAEKLDCHTSYISRSCNLILEEQIVLDPLNTDSENKMNECKNLQRQCVDWVETCKILLAGVHGDPVELPITPNSSDPVDSIRTQVRIEASVEPTTDKVKEVKDESKTNPREGELTVCKSPVVQLISYDGNIAQKSLGESSVHLTGTDELVLSPVTEEAQRAFSDLTTVVKLQRELHDSEVRVLNAEQRSLKAEEALQAALEKIQDLERQLQGQPNLEAKSNEEEKKTPSSSPLTEAIPAPLKKTTEVKPSSSTKKTKKR